MKRQSYQTRNRGFSLVELLVVIAIIAVLSSLAFTGAKQARLSAKMAKEIAAGRALGAAYMIDAVGNHGHLMAGSDPDAPPATDRNGAAYPNYVTKRYLARLAPALDWNFSGSACVNETDVWSQDFYMATANPAFGMNVTFVGGAYSETEPDPDRDADRYGQFCIRHLSQVDAASEQMVFISARLHSGGPGEGVYGNSYVRSPYLEARRWSSKFDVTQTSLRWGNVHPRYRNKAVAVFLDGAVRMLGLEEQQDMRYWAKGARQADDPEWTIE